MKYLVSAIELGQLYESDNKERRLEIINNIISLKYILKTSDNLDLIDHIEINKNRRK